MLPKYVVFNTNMTDKQGKTLPVGQGDDLDELLTVYHGKAYEEPKTVRDARKMIERGY